MSRNINNISQTNGYNVVKPLVEKQWSDMYMASTKQGTGDMGKFIPVYVRELLPGQKINLEQTVSLQFTPWMTNLMHEITGELMTFFVPYRICAFMRPTETYGDEEMPDTREEADQTKWEAYITGGKTGKVDIKLDYIDYADIIKSYSNADANGEKLIGTLLDYFGMPILPLNTDTSTLTEAAQINMLCWNAYNLIYNTKLRNPDYTEWKTMKVTHNATSAAARKAHRDVNRVATGYWNADRFTRARKMQLRGITPTIPIGNELITLAHEWQQLEGEDTSTTRNLDQTSLALLNPGYDDPDATAQDKRTLRLAVLTQNTAATDSDTGTADIELKNHSIPKNSLTTQLDLNEFLKQMGILRLSTDLARIQPKLTDFLKTEYGIIPQDSRFQEPEFISSETFSIGVETVTATATTTSGDLNNTYQGNISSQGWGSGNSKKIYTAQEHGVIMTLMIVRPKAVYEGGLERFWKGDRTRFDFALPQLINLPDQRIHKGELRFTGTNADKDLFAWEQIFDEYRSDTNKVTGLLRPSLEGNTETPPLITYTLARYFANQPEMNDIFLLCNPDMDRIKQYTDQPDFIFFVRSEIKTAIPIPMINQPVNLGIN